MGYVPEEEVSYKERAAQQAAAAAKLRGEPEVRSSPRVRCYDLRRSTDTDMQYSGSSSTAVDARRVVLFKSKPNYLPTAIPDVG